MTTEKKWSWVAADVALAIHDQQLARHSGLEGIRAKGAFESALARPQNLAAHGTPDVADLAAAYAFGLARNPAFNDGNKRTAWVVARLFLADNGCTLNFDAKDAVITMEAIAAGQIDEGKFAARVRERIIYA